MASLIFVYHRFIYPSYLKILVSARICSLIKAEEINALLFSINSVFLIADINPSKCKYMFTEKPSKVDSKEN